MKINAANINMSSSRIYEETTFLKSTSAIVNKSPDDKKEGATFSLSDEMKRLLKNLEDENAERTQNATQTQEPLKAEEDPNVETLRKLLELLKKLRAKLRGEKYHPDRKSVV